MNVKNVMKNHYRKKKIEDITDADDTHAKRVCKDFKVKKLVEYHDLYDQSENCS